MIKKDEFKVIARNKKASHDYFILEKYEAGLELFGTEIKSIRLGKVSINEAYVDFKNGEAKIINMTKNDDLKEAFNSSYGSLENLYSKFNDYSETK